MARGGKEIQPRDGSGVSFPDMGGASGVEGDLVHSMDELRPRVERRRGAVRSGGRRWGWL